VSAGEYRLLTWAIGIHVGVPRPQGAKSHYISEVRAVGQAYRSASGRGYHTNASLDFHMDDADLVLLGCYNGARSGGQSLVSSSTSAWNTLRAERPDLAEIATQDIPYSRNTEEAPDEAPYYQQPLFDRADACNWPGGTATVSGLRSRSRACHSTTTTTRNADAACTEYGSPHRTHPASRRPGSLSTEASNPAAFAVASAATSTTTGVWRSKPARPSGSRCRWSHRPGFRDPVLVRRRTVFAVALLYQAIFGELGAGQLGDDPSILEDQDPVTHLGQVLVLCRTVEDR
jgi:TfdA family taurine catabolism dioxygenase TauD